MLSEEIETYICQLKKLNLVLTLLSVDNLSKKFDSFEAVKDLTFSVNKGDIYGFLGPNGAGKSTTLRMILGLVHPSGGTITINNNVISSKNRDYLNSIGALIENPSFYNNLTAFDNLKLFALLSKVNDSSRVNTVLEQVGLLHKSTVKVGAFSQGMKQRLGIAQAILHKPELVILDEPSNGLDPQGQADIRRLIQQINSEMGITFIISSHILVEIEKIANRMLVINNGKQIIEGNVYELMSKEKMKVRFKTSNQKKLLNLLDQQKITHFTENEFIVTSVQEEQISSMIDFIVSNDIKIDEVRQLRTLEELFLKWTE